MRTVALRGGLGNQLFGLAFAHTIRLLTGTPVAVAPDASARSLPTPFDLAALAKPLDLEVMAPGLAAPGPIVREGPPPSDRDHLRALIARGRHFVGYWQHPIYVAEPEAARRTIGAALRERLPAAAARPVVIHYRTYADEPLPWRRGAPPPAYFAKALAGLEVSAAPVLVSDRPSLARQRLRRAIADVAVVDGTVAEHLAILLGARALVLANSSFSWWAGFCGAAERPVYPRRGACFHYPAPAPGFRLI